MYRQSFPSLSRAPFAAVKGRTAPLFLELQRDYSTSDKPFDKILIANRGEIACRVMKTCKKMGIKTVAVYSTADSKSKHVAMADEAICVGPPPTSQSYLNIENVIKAIKQTGAQAVHPGYGFLSENFQFAKALEENKIVFIGPDQHAIHAMGDKIESKKLAKTLNVHTIPGFNGEVNSDDHAVAIAKEIGYPVMVKASAGGGGKGMRIAWSDDEVREVYRLCRSEAKSSFGDDRLLVEKFIDNPRHVEIQILGDKHGNTLYLNERECSIQRRNQKVIEEAPSSHIDPATRAAMGQQAVTLAKAVKYTSAGTVEFLVDSQRNFYFLEMNTRLQVEHPITEYITGIDIVENMINIAAGRKLPFTQNDIKIDGWAFESRVYAEDPLQYLPSIGRLNTYIEPSTKNGDVRVDSGILEGSEISVYYDPLISKLCTHGKNRQEAIDKMVKALDSYVIKGVTHNVPLLREVYTNPHFKSGAISTKFLPTYYPKGFAGKVLEGNDLKNFLSTAALVYAKNQIYSQNWKEATVQHISDKSEFDVFITIDGKEHATHIKILNDSEFSIKIDGETHTLQSNWSIFTPIIGISIDGKESTLQYLDSHPDGYTLQYCGAKYKAEVRSPEQQALKKHMKEKPKVDMSKFVVSPMPGNVVSVSVKPGSRVIAGQEVAIVEAMKMQNVLRSERTGIVKSVFVSEGKAVEGQQPIVEFEDEKKEEKK